MKPMKLRILKIALALLTVAMFVAVLIRARSEKVEPARVGRLVTSIYGLGTVTADEIYRAKAGVSLQLRDIPVKEGEEVPEGAILARFEDSVVRAPFPGTVSEIAFKLGEIVPPQTPVLTLTNLNRLYLEVNLEQQSVLRVTPSAPVSVSFESFRSEPYIGAVKYVFPRESQFIVRIELEKWPKGVLPGMTADVAIQASAKDAALMIPIKSLKNGQVIRVRNGHRARLGVTLGSVAGDWAEVAEGDILPSDGVVVRRR